MIIIVLINISFYTGDLFLSVVVLVVVFAEAAVPGLVA